MKNEQALIEMLNVVMAESIMLRAILRTMLERLASTSRGGDPHLFLDSVKQQALLVLGNGKTAIERQVCQQASESLDEFFRQVLSDVTSPESTAPN